MPFLKDLFGLKSAPVSIPADDFFNVIWNQPRRFTKDNDYTDYVFKTLGIARINHPKSNTWMYVSNPGQKVPFETLTDYETPRTALASQGVFVTAYNTPFMGRYGLGFLVRDRLDGIKCSQPNRHVSVAMAGFENPDTYTFDITRIRVGELNSKKRVQSLYNLPVTPENAAKAFELATLGIGQIMRDEPIDLAGNIIKAWKLRRTAENLDNPAPKP